MFDVNLSIQIGREEGNLQNKKKKKKKKTKKQRIFAWRLNKCIITIPSENERLLYILYLVRPYIRKLLSAYRVSEADFPHHFCRQAQYQGSTLG